MPPKPHPFVRQNHWAGLAQFSHEVRNHLTGILGLTALLKESVPAEKQREVALRIESAAHALLIVVNNLLAAHSPKQHSFSACKDFNPAELTEDIATMLSPTAESQGLELICTTNSFKVGNVRGDALGFRQLVTNLITNAIKFTKRGHIVVSLEAKRIGSITHLRLEVTDTGIGVSPAQQKEIFKPFVQLTAGQKSRITGSGLGLAIVQKITQSMRGDITLKSQLGHGSTFRIELTLPSAPSKQTLPIFTRPCLVMGGLRPQSQWLIQILSDWGAECTEIDSSQVIEVTKKIRQQTRKNPLLFVDIPSGCTTIPKLNKNTLLLRGLGWNLSQHPALTKPLTARNLFKAICKPKIQIQGTVASPWRILLVEDHIINQETIVAFLQRNGHRVDSVPTGQTAQTRLSNQHYDVAVIDLGLPDMSGLTLARSLQKRYPHLALIALSGTESTSLKQRCLQAGFFTHVTKPYHPAQFAEAIQQAVRETQENRADQQRACALLLKRLSDECVLLETAYQTGRTDRIASTVHALRGALAMAGLQSWTRRAAKIEHLATVNDTQSALQKLQKFISDLRRFSQSVNSS